MKKKIFLMIKYLAFGFICVLAIYGVYDLSYNSLKSSTPTDHDRQMIAIGIIDMGSSMVQFFNDYELYDYQKSLQIITMAMNYNIIKLSQEEIATASKILKNMQPDQIEPSQDAKTTPDNI